MILVGRLVMPYQFTEQNITVSVHFERVMVTETEELYLFLKEFLKAKEELYDDEGTLALVELQFDSHAASMPPAPAGRRARAGHRRCATPNTFSTSARATSSSPSSAPPSCRALGRQSPIPGAAMHSPHRSRPTANGL